VQEKDYEFSTYLSASNREGETAPSISMDMKTTVKEVTSWIWVAGHLGRLIVYHQ